MGTPGTTAERLQRLASELLAALGPSAGEIGVEKFLSILARVLEASGLRLVDYQTGGRDG